MDNTDKTEQSKITTSKMEVSKNIFEQKMVYYTYTGKPIDYKVIFSIKEAWNQKGKNPFLIFLNRDNNTMMLFCGRIDEFYDVQEKHKLFAKLTLQPFETGSEKKWEIRLFNTFTEFSEALDYYKYIMGYDVNTYYDLWRN